MSQSHQLAAIMFTDIAGYTALMGEDEEKAFDVLKKNRELQKPIIEQFNGHWIKELGDGVLASYNSVSDAVTAAIKIQEACNAAKDFQLRIGIHLGEVIFENDDVFGDGVNIASRIQAVAEPGSIYISESVYNNVSNKQDISARFVKQETLKNVKEPVRVYEILIKTSRPPLVYPSNSDPEQKKISCKSIAVLPFVNMSSDPEQEYFSDGITEDIIAHISKIRDLKVISRTSIMQYKQTKKSLMEISSDLKVVYILEGSVRRSGSRLRIVVQLIDAGNDEHIWAETYDRDLTDVFAIQTEIAENVATGLKTRLTSNERKRIATKPTENLEAYNFYMLGRSHYHKATSSDFNQAINYYNKAISLDPGFAVAYAALAVARLYIGVGYWGIRPHEALPEAFMLAEKAHDIDPNLSDAYAAKAEVYDWYYFNWNEADDNYKLAIELNPSNATAHLYRAYNLAIRRRFAEAFAEREQAIELDPHSILIRLNAFIILMLANQSAKALEEARLLSKLEPASSGNWFCIGWMASQLGLAEESISAYREAYRLTNGETFMKISLAYGLSRAGQQDEARNLLAEIHQQEQKEFVWPMGIALCYAHLSETEKALDYLEKSYEERVGWMLFIGCDPTLDILRKEPRFKELVRKIGPPEAIAEIDKFG
ncbi:adenylate/guanylate cyclase domain-containing protein [Terrimonas pollutisoli]|uniref:adenylate/guanylate cyclase domain-containing protein n=1 Tax=Terrimonas pollutisoli TaxID=3034147 RepID=UPI0023ECBE6F|nr:adenylate/guanylate cyclase domain-containing protein [Terrimonas sp. H1YJ31]